MPRKGGKQEALEAAEAVLAAEIVNCILETNYDSEPDLFMSSTLTLYIPGLELVYGRFFGVSGI